MNDGVAFLNPNFGFCIILIIPLILWYFQKGRDNSIIIGAIIFLAFTEGSLHLLNILDPAVNRLIREALTLILVFLLLINNRKYCFPGIGIAFLLLILSIVSLVLSSDTSVQQFILFSRRIFFNLIFFYVLINLPFREKEVRRLINLVKYLFLVQIVVYFIKFLLWGITEEYIGTVSAYGGSITNSLAAIGIIYSISHYSGTKDKKYIFLLFCFFLVAIIGAKRGIIFFIFSILLYIFLFSGKLSILNFIKFSLIAPVIMLIFFMLTPSLNPSNKIGGKPDISYAFDQLLRRIMFDKEKDAGKTYERSTAIYTYFIINNIDLKTILFGMGPGIAFPKNSYEMEKYGVGEEFLNNKYSLGYGMRTGALWLSFQAGVLFALLYVYYHFKICKSYILNYSQHFNKELILFIKLFLIIFVIDYFTYSSTFITPSVIPIVFYMLIGFLINPTSKQLVDSKF